MNELERGLIALYSRDDIDRKAFMIKRDLTRIAIGYKCRITRSMNRKLKALRNDRLHSRA